MDDMDLENTFVQADSRNLPEVNTMMILEYIISSKKHSIDEIRAVKKLAASDENYIIDAVGFVELTKDENETKCIVKAKVASKEETEMKYFSVSVHVNESEHTITNSSCDCRPESADGCCHSLLFLCWLENKSSIPERAPVQCFWHKPLLGTNYPMLIKDIFKSKSQRSDIELPPRNPDVLKKFIEECKKRNITNSLIMHYYSEEQ
ncbi:uncharacterized protein LOC125226622 [Leguminivora glycinivorella]|uniref:uncharacterized protein LOC125226622 n=1 Tax=Leguminivora glycinivorella TaxID=1035111 RepID=UPI00200D2AC2|nr:uncharacterized protein LOC125226622 [Leguminivora glycinivorella]